jgi:hypothetical protein
VSLDWFLEIGQQVTGLFAPIREIDTQIARLDRRNNEARDRLSAERRHRVEELWNTLDNMVPHYPSLLLTLSLLSQHPATSDLRELILARYVQVVHRDGGQRLCRHVEANGLDPLLEMCRPLSQLPTGLPRYSCLVTFKFTLASPYVSKDERTFYIHDNPVRRDRTLALPIVSGTAWKGNLRKAARLSPVKAGPDEILSLFGNEREDEGAFRRGRLTFFPTFFGEIDVEVINPHDRKTKAGTMPIYIETVPAGAKGLFGLSYVPFDLFGMNDSDAVACVRRDYTVISQSIARMMLYHGFAAKSSYGFGVISPQVEGVFAIAGPSFPNRRFSAGFESFEGLEGLMDQALREGGGL